MSRRDEVVSSYEKPAEKYLEWASNDKGFRYYDKNEGGNVAFTPEKMLFLAERHTVKGWSDPDETGIFSPEVVDLGKEPLTVKTYKGRTIAKGLYSDIKEVVNAAGGRYTKSIYMMLPDGSIVNLQLKGIALKSWMDFTQKSKARLADEWVVVDSIGEGKKGSVKYSFPVFAYNGSLTATQGEQADMVYDKLKKALSPSARVAEVVEDDRDFEDIGSIADEF